MNYKNDNKMIDINNCVINKCFDYISNFFNDLNDIYYFKFRKLISNFDIQKKTI